MGRAADILSYWRAVELFDPQGIPVLPKPGAALRRKPGTACVERIRFDAAVPVPPLPWQAGHPRAGEEPAAGMYGSEWRHTVYGGVFSYSDVRNSFARVLGHRVPGHRVLGGTEQPDHDGKQEGKQEGEREDVVSAMFAFVVDKDGRLIEGTEAFSPCAWATGRLNRPGPGDPGWLEGFGEVMRECAQAVRRAAGLACEPGAGDREPGPGDREPGDRGPGAGDRGPGDTENNGRVVRAPDVLALAWRLTRRLGLPPGIADPTEMRVVSTPVYRNKDGTLPNAAPPLLGSLIAPDIQRVRDAVRTPRGIGSALASYLSEPVGQRQRTDITRDPASLLDGVRPALFPPARWPAAADRPLTVGQQFAVNAIFGETGEIGDKGGLFSVHEASGAGTIALLRDLIAAIIVRRAQVLATLRDPMDGFAEEHTWTTGDGHRESVWQPRADLTGFEIVVASAGHAAGRMRRLLPSYERAKAPSAQWGEEVERFAGTWDRSVKMAAAREAAAEALRSPLGAAQDTERAERHIQGQPDLACPRGLRAVLDTVQGGPKRKAWRARTEALARQQETLRRAVAQWGGAVPVHWLEFPAEAQERSAPWSDPEWLRARAEVFLAAVCLHRAFVAATAPRFLRNMRHVLALVSGDPSAPPEGEAATAAWQTMFLVVPVVAVTFGSCGRTFGALGREALGWLLVDGAGQTAPQAAVGALWRSRRAVLVGDLGQRAPASRVPGSDSRVPGEIQRMLREAYGVGAL